MKEDIKMIMEMIKALFFIFMAEMGDKTQILAMVFATRFPIKKVFLGIGIGSFLNHGLAVLLGYYLSSVIPLEWLQLIAGICFIGFSLWSLQIEQEEEMKESAFQWGPVGTVALAFFVGELGDKTQLTAITLSAEATYPFFVLLGTVSGMLCTGALGIWVGSKVGDKVPEVTMKIVSSALFLFFGIVKLYKNIPSSYVQLLPIVGGMIIIVSLYYWRLHHLLAIQREQKTTLYQKTAAILYESTRQIRETVDHICLGEGTCGTCQGDHCLVGYTKLLTEYAMTQKQYKDIKIPFPTQYTVKSFNRHAVMETYTLTLYYLFQLKEEEQDFVLHGVRQAMETILFNTSIPYDGNFENYRKEIKIKNPDMEEKIMQMIESLQMIA